MLRSSITSLLSLHCGREQNPFLVGFFALFSWDSPTRAMHSLNINMENKITLASLLQYCSMSEFRITPSVAKVTYLITHVCRDTYTHTYTHRYRKESLWQVYDALKLPNINISNCPFVCYSRRFLHAEAMHHSKMTERYAFVLFLDLRCIDLV